MHTAAVCFTVRRKDPLDDKLPKVISICLLSLLCSLPAAVGDIEAVKGKKYTLTKQHGPWMVLVATIRDIDEKERRIEGGMTAREAADALVYELRLKKIPAYVHIHQEKVERLDENTGAAMDGRHFISQHGSISVLAGNFRSNTDEDLARLRDWIRDKFSPKFLEDSKNGGLYAKTPGRPTILKPFITVNPLLSPEEVREKDARQAGDFPEFRHGTFAVPQQGQVHTRCCHVLREQHSSDWQSHRRIGQGQV